MSDLTPPPSPLSLGEQHRKAYLKRQEETQQNPPEMTITDVSMRSRGDGGKNSRPFGAGDLLDSLSAQDAQFIEAAEEISARSFDKGDLLPIVPIESPVAGPGLETGEAPKLPQVTVGLQAGLDGVAPEHPQPYHFPEVNIPDDPNAIVGGVRFPKRGETVTNPDGSTATYHYSPDTFAEQDDASTTPPPDEGQLARAQEIRKKILFQPDYGAAPKPKITRVRRNARAATQATGKVVEEVKIAVKPVVEVVTPVVRETTRGLAGFGLNALKGAAVLAYRAARGVIGAARSDRDVQRDQSQITQGSEGSVQSDQEAVPVGPENIDDVLADAAVRYPEDFDILFRYAIDETGNVILPEEYDSYFSTMNKSELAKKLEDLYTVRHSIPANEA